jgi:hypothetical protein
MKNRKKNFILGTVLCLLLLVSITAIVFSQVQRCVVYSKTSTYRASFTATGQNPGWSWSIDHDADPNHAVSLSVQDLTTGQYILSLGFVRYDTSGAIGITHNHSYELVTTLGDLQIPGWATCSVQNASWNPDGPVHQ